MDAAWKNEFEPWIFARGRKYFEEERVNQITQDGNLILATVSGTEEYRVELELPGGSVNYMSCSCPYFRNGNNCKHIAAALFAIKDGEYTFTDDPPTSPITIAERVPVEERWLEAIDTLPEEVIRKELLKLADRDERLKLRLSLLLTGKLPEGQLNNWKADVQEIAASYMSRGRYIREEDMVEYIYEETLFLKNKLAALKSVNATMDAFYLTSMVYETVMEIPLEDKEDVELFLLMDDCEEAWEELFAKAAPDEMKLMHQWYWEHRNLEWPFGYMLDTFFLNLKWPEELFQENLRLCKLYKIEIDLEDD